MNRREILRILSVATQSSSFSIIRHFLELRSLNSLDRHMEKSWVPRDDPFTWATRKAAYGPLYALVRGLRPSVVLETGVEIGATSALILTALEKNQKGKLYSLDISPTLPGRGGLPTGYVVPAPLRSRWKLEIVDAKAGLPRICGDLGRIDLFYHDSDHSYEHMLFEFRTVWPFLREDGVLIADDVEDPLATDSGEKAFETFTKETHQLGHILGRFGIVRRAG